MSNITTYVTLTKYQNLNHLQAALEKVAQKVPGFSFVKENNRIVVNYDPIQAYRNPNLTFNKATFGDEWAARADTRGCQNPLQAIMQEIEACYKTESNLEALTKMGYTTQTVESKDEIVILAQRY